MRGSTYNLSNREIEVVSQMVEDRSYAKKKREYHRSDEISEKLKYKYNVRVDDKNREWSVVAVANTGRESDDDLSISSFEEEYVPSPLAPPNHPTHTMSNEIKLQIARLISDRTAHRQNKEYKMADEILNQLFEKHLVVVDDRTKEWKVVDDDDNEDDEFAKGAQLSQRSAFARKARGSSERRIDDTTSKDALFLTQDDDAILPNEQAEEETRDLESLTVVELKDKLRHLGLPVSGKKADLISRLSNL